MRSRLSKMRSEAVMKQFSAPLVLLCVPLLFVGCGDDDTGTTDAGTDTSTGEDAAPDVGDDAADAAPDGGDSGPAPAEEDDTLHTALQLNLDDGTGVATLRLHDDGDGITWLDVPSADVVVERADGTPITVMVDPENDHRIGVPMAETIEELTFRYTFGTDLAGEGWDGELGFSILWPTFCGALFPCDPSPADGTTFEAEIEYTGDRTVVFPERIDFQTPAYAFGIAALDLEKVILGATEAGTSVAMWIPPDASDEVRNGPSNLVTHMNFLEETYGPYPYGGEVGSVFVADNDDMIGGMEHHPYWHVVEGLFADPVVHSHEATHGWFGNGVRIACWEDLVLSEGVAQYMTARAFSSTGGDEAMNAQFEFYLFLTDMLLDDDRPDFAAWRPDSCDQAIEFDWVPYFKGPLFFHAIAQRTSFEQVDAALASFFEAHKGTAKRLQDLIDHIERELEIDVTEEVDGWLLSVDTRPE